MSAFKKFVKTTLVGGIMFLVPVALVAVVLRHAMQFAMKAAAPIAAAFPRAEIVGIGVITLVAALILLLIAFLAGLLSRTAPGRRLTHWFEESILGGLPQYRMVKSMAEGLAQIEDGSGMRPVLVRGDEGWQLAYHLEDLPGDWVAVFLPQSPTPMSGNVVYVAAHKVRALELGMPAAMKLVKSIGVGSADALRGVDLGNAREG
jgi:uncharacterized membrane protein